ncbi:hypothetical protein [Candidatus Cyanaurora vandensis]|uniref:hypothetical protein n=1 Tax=Candidatus Cyanaurora vandensis TaxID=2714958 RepID=UPI00257C49F9|nr:hypothetical protein [Candidatus Cyanaurora vandensis]
MPTANETFYNRFIGGKCFFKTDAGALLSIPTCTPVLDPGISEETQMTLSNTGRMIPVDQYITQESAQLEVKFGAGIHNPSIMEMQLGRLFGTINKVVTVRNQFVVPASLSYPAAVTGTLGFGLVADSALCSLSAANGTTTQLTRVASAGSPVLTASQFYQVVNGGFTFHAAAAGLVATWEAALPSASVLALSASLIGNYSILGYWIDKFARVWRFECPQAQSVKKSKIDPGAQETSLTFNLFPTAGVDLPYSIDYTGVILG